MVCKYCGKEVKRYHICPNCELKVGAVKTFSEECRMLKERLAQIKEENVRPVWLMVYEGGKYEIRTHYDA